MWLFTSKGFISVVADKNDTSGTRLLVRARNKEHLKEISEYLSCEPFQVERSDYSWRAWIKRTDFAALLISYISSLSYTNFKNSISDMDYHDACLGVWEEMWKYQNSLR